MSEKKSRSTKPVKWHLKKALDSHQQTLRHLTQAGQDQDSEHFVFLRQIEIAITELLLREQKRTL